MENREQDEERLILVEQRLVGDPHDRDSAIEYGQILQRLGRYEEAQIAYRNALHRNPDHPVLLQMLGELCYERGNITQALHYWEPLLTSPQAGEDVYLGCVRAYTMVGYQRKAYETSKEARKAYPEQTAFYLQGLSDHIGTEKEKYVAASQVIYLSDQVHSSASHASAKGQALCYLKQYTEAKQALQQAIALEPDHPELAMTLGNIVEEAGQPEEAQVSFEQALHLYDQQLARYPVHLLTIIAKGDVLCKLQRFTEALTCYDKALKLDDKAARVWFVRGGVLCQLQRYRDALDAYERAIGLDALYEKVTLASGASLMGFVRTEQRLAATEEKLRDNPADVHLLCEEARHLTQQKRYEAALAAVQEALQLNGELAAVHLECANILYNAGRYQEAKQAYDQAYKLGSPASETIKSRRTLLDAVIACDMHLQKQPDDWRKVLEKLEKLWQMSFYTEARQIYSQICQASAFDVEACLALAGASYYDLATALGVMQVAKQHHLLDYRIYDRLSDLLYTHRRYDEAQAVAEYALKLDKEQSWKAKRVLEKVQELFVEKQRGLGNLSNSAVQYVRQGSNAWNSWRARQKQETFNLSFLDLHALNLAGMNLSQSDLSQSDLSQCNLTEANLSGARLEQACLRGSTLVMANARHIVASEIELRGAELSGIDLRGAELSGANLARAFHFFSGRTQRRAIMEHSGEAVGMTNMCETGLRGGKLEGVVLDYAQLVRADLREATMTRSLFRYANLREANLAGANLFASSLAGAKLVNADLRGANLMFVDLRGAELTGANLRGAQLYQAQLDASNVREVILSLVDFQAPVDLFRRRSLAATLAAPLFSEDQPMAAPSVSTTEARAGVLSTIIRCQAPTCEQVMHLELVTEGRSHEDDQYQVTRAGASKPASLICDYISEYTQSWHPLGKDYERIQQALRQGDMAALYALKEGYAPFYCQYCHGSYCYDHMRFQEVWDDFYVHPDYWYGTCPYGHPIFVDH